MFSAISTSRKKNRYLLSTKWVKLTSEISSFFGADTWTTTQSIIKILFSLFALTFILEYHRVFTLDVIGYHVGVQVVPMIIIYQQKILFTFFYLNSFTLITNIKVIKFHSNVQSSFVCTLTNWHAGMLTE